MGKCEEMSEAPVASTIDVSRETLLTRLEAATEGTRELDALIVTTLCPRATVGGYIGGDEGDTVFHAQPLGISNKDACPHYTTSLDAALTLVPEALTKQPAWWGVRRGGLTYFHAWLGMIEPYDEDGLPQGIWAHADTPATALCIAALKARS